MKCVHFSHTKILSTEIFFFHLRGPRNLHSGFFLLTSYRPLRLPLTTYKNENLLKINAEPPMWSANKKTAFHCNFRRFMSVSQSVQTLSNYSPVAADDKKTKVWIRFAGLPPGNLCCVKHAACDLAWNLWKSCSMLMLYSLPHYTLPSGLLHKYMISADLKNAAYCKRNLKYCLRPDQGWVNTSCRAHILVIKWP